MFGFEKLQTALERLDFDPLLDCLETLTISKQLETLASLIHRCQCARTQKVLSELYEIKHREFIELLTPKEDE